MSRTWIAGLLAVSTLWLAACGQAAPTGPVEVQVTLTEFAVESSLTEFRVGVPYHFVVTNKGAIPHEIMIMPVLGGRWAWTWNSWTRWPWR